MFLSKSRVGTSVKMVAALSVLTLLAACAGRPSTPPADYATSSIHGAVRVAIDQDGNLYPRSSTALNWDSQASANDTLLGGGFRLAALQRDGQALYSPAVQKQALDGVAAELNRRLERRASLVVFIHGFNAGFGDGADTFKKMHDYVHDSARANAVFLEVFWDGYQARVLPGNPSSTFWQPSLAHSELAGQRALRSIMARITEDVDVRIVTHSRGAAVAMAMLTCPGGERAACAPQLANKHIKSIMIAAVAPAIGLRDLQVAALPSNQPVELVLGFNRKDIASGKYFLPNFSGSATDLGSDTATLGKAMATQHPNVKLHAVEFSHGPEHALEAYFDRAPEVARCMYALIGLQPAGRACPTSMAPGSN